MRVLLRRLAALLLVVAICWVSWISIGLAEPASIWLGNSDPVVGRGPAKDYMDLFKPNAAWREAARVVKVFQAPNVFIAAAPDEDVRQMIDGLRARHIALAMQGLMLTGTSTCGNRIEGYSGKTIDIAVARLKRLGADLQFIAMDEPLWFGHQYEGTQACHTPIPELARAVAAKVAMIKGAFPSIQIGDDEPVSPANVPGWNDEVMQWTQAYRVATGEQLAFFHADVQWQGDWRSPLKEIAARLRAARVRFGTIYVGNGSDQSNEEWTHHAEERFVSAEADPALVPDDAVLYGWMAKPDRVLPESLNGTMTNLVLRYAAGETELKVGRKDHTVQGVLADNSGKPVPGAQLEIQAVDRGPGPLVAYQLSGLVPSDASTAGFGLRINTECACDAAADVAFGVLTYRDEHSGQTEAHRFELPASALRGGRVVARPGQGVLFNGPRFAVTPSDRFIVTVPMDASYQSRKAGYITIIFFDKDGKGLVRMNLPIQPRSQALGTVTTNGLGGFTFVPDQIVLSRSPGYLITFRGNDAFRPTSAFVQ